MNLCCDVTEFPYLQNIKDVKNLWLFCHVTLISFENKYYNIMRVLALCKSYLTAMNKIFIYAHLCVNKIM